MPEPGQAVRILVVEDDEIIAELIADMLTDAGYDVVGPFLSLRDALQPAESETFDVALLDVNLAGRPSDPIAELLARRNIPFVFLTGYGKGVRPTRFPKTPVVCKPFEPKDLIDALTQILIASAVR